MNQLKRLFFYTKPYRLRFNLSLFFTALFTFARASQPFIIGLAISQLARDVKAGTGINFKYIGGIVAALIITSIVDAICEYFSDYLLADVVQSSMRDVRNDISKKINTLPVSYFDRHKQGDTLGRITTDVDVVANALQQGTLRVVGALLTLIFSITFMAIRSPSFTVIAVLVFPICFFIYRFFLKKSQPLFTDLQDTLGDLNGYSTEHYTSYEVVQLFGQEEKVSGGFNKIIDKLAHVGFKSNFAASSINPILSHVTHLFYIGLFLVMALTVLNQPLIIGGITVAAAIDVGGLQSFIQYVWQSGGPIRDITQLSGIFQAAAASLGRVFELLDEVEEPEQPALAGFEPDAIQGKVELKNLQFGYDKAKPLMQNINMTVNPGDMVAIVGPTGAGKTTLINLLMRFYDIDSGSISIDGIDVSTLSKEQSRSLFGMVLQDPWLYYASVADNIRFGKLDATKDEVKAAAKVARVDYYIRTLPDGYKTMINEESSNISQGQKQLITIARAIVKNPKILILDEATSSVDTRLEYHIQTAMAKVTENRTSFVIAHRLSTIRNADLILVIDSGNIVEQGTHEELLEKDGMYKELYESQFSTA